MINESYRVDAFALDESEFALSELTLEQAKTQLRQAILEKCEAQAIGLRYFKMWEESLSAPEAEPVPEWKTRLQWWAGFTWWNWL